jgi:hypothetical protein
VKNLGKKCFLIVGMGTSPAVLTRRCGREFLCKILQLRASSG